jgi:uncharacterized protein YegP (UPF0339 family)
MTAFQRRPPIPEVDVLELGERVAGCIYRENNGARWNRLASLAGRLGAAERRKREVPRCLRCNQTLKGIGVPERPDTTEIFEDAAGGFRWRRVAPNGEIIASSGESFTREADAVRAATRVFGDAF